MLLFSFLLCYYVCIPDLTLNSVNTITMHSLDIFSTKELYNVCSCPRSFMYKDLANVSEDKHGDIYSSHTGK